MLRWISACIQCGSRPHRTVRHAERGVLSGSNRDSKDIGQLRRPRCLKPYIYKARIIVKVDLHGEPDPLNTTSKEYKANEIATDN